MTNHEWLDEDEVTHVTKALTEHRPISPLLGMGYTCSCTNPACRMAELLEGVRDYAMAHYEDDGGWDYIIETFEDEELIEIIGTARTVKGAIRKVKWYADLLGERRADVVGEIW